AQKDYVYRAKVDASDNIVRISNGASTGNWEITTAQFTTTSVANRADPNTAPEIRRRGTAVAVNGYLYVISGHDGATGNTLRDVLVGKINMSSGDIASFRQLRGATAANPSQVVTDRWDAAAATANGYIYQIGGCFSGGPPTSCNATIATGLPGTIEYLQIYNNVSGSPASYSNATSYATNANRLGNSAAIYNGFIYVAGGCTGATECATAVVNDVQYAPLNADGTVGAWNTTSAMGTNRAFFKLVASNGYMYALGGQSGTTAATALASTERATINGVGTLAAWAADTSLGAGNERSGLDATAYNGFMYVTGGSNTAGTAQTTVYYSAINSGTGVLGAWTSNANQFPTGRSGHILVTYGSTMYILGGFDGTNYLLDVQYAPIAANGSVGTWNDGTKLPQPVRQGAGFAANGYLYVFGGRSAVNTCTENTYVAPINGFLVTTGTSTGLGIWSQTAVSFPSSTTRYGLAAAYDNGRAYLLGGGCGATLTYPSNGVIFSTLQSQPQVARYSYRVDTDSDVFPSKWLINGLDNGIGASWTLKYRSATNAAGVWGQTANYGKVGLGTPATYTPLDGVGANTNFARYFFFDLTIDSSQAFGYPEDVSRGPNIYDLTLLFTSDPGKRLIHGTTFTGGEKQPLDTPF
ncbi:MAG: hypothetical protein ABWY71_02095, partial [Candidatus Saccharimonadales bacterium]